MKLTKEQIALIPDYDDLSLIDSSERVFSNDDLRDLNEHNSFICQCCGEYLDYHYSEAESPAPICIDCWNDESQDAI